MRVCAIVGLVITVIGADAAVTAAAPVRAEVRFKVQDSESLNGPLAGITFLGEAVWDPAAVVPAGPSLQPLGAGSGLLDFTLDFDGVTYDETDGAASGVSGLVAGGDPLALILTDTGTPVGLDFSFPIPATPGQSAFGTLTNNTTFEEFAYTREPGFPPSDDGFAEGRISFGEVTEIPSPTAAWLIAVAGTLAAVRRVR